MPDPDPRKIELAKIHIAKKSLHLDDGTYQQIIREIGGASSGSSGDLSADGRRKVIAHFVESGWKPESKGDGHAQIHGGPRNAFMATVKQIKYIRYLWIRLADNDVVKQCEESGLRAWIQSNSKHLDTRNIGYSAPEFLPRGAARELIESLKKWAERTNTRI